MNSLASLRSLFSPRAIAAATALGCLAAPLFSSPAWASAYPAKPSHLHVANVTRTTFTITAANSANARSYTLYASTDKKDIYESHLREHKASSAMHSSTASRPRVTVSGLSFTTDPVYYRLEANNGSRHSYTSNIREVGLKPSTPSSLNRMLNGTDATTLTWHAASRATGYTVVQATNSAMTANRRTYTIGDAAEQFTPFGLTEGQTYYYEIRAMNNGTPSSYTTPIAETVRTREQSMRIMTYNILINSSDGTREPGGRIASWSKRGPAQAALIKHVDPDVLAVQEGNHLIGNTHVRQVDSLRAYLADDGEHYTVAHTEVTWAERERGVAGYARTGDYILYKPSVYQPVGAGGYYAIGDERFAAYQELRNVSSGAKILVISAHTHANHSSSWDSRREAETKQVVSHGQSIANADGGVPVTYEGDFNSSAGSPGVTFDGPGRAMRDANVDDAKDVAQHLTNAQYDSMNEYRRAPWAYGIIIDYVWTAPGVATKSWGMAMPLSHGRFTGTIPSDHNPVYATLIYKY